MNHISVPALTKIFDVRKQALPLFSLITAILIARIIASGSYNYLLLIFISSALLFLYLKQFELFILLMLFINENGFYLFPREPLGAANYQDLLYLVLLITGVFYFFRKEKQNEVNFNIMIISLLLIVTVSVLNSYFHGQPMILGFRAARGYYLILFYFVFMGKKINLQKLFRLIVITGVLLTLINNIQYIFFGDLNIFYFSGELERSGRLRFLIGDFFTIFSPIIALGEYLANKKKMYLVAFIYMVGTVIIQGQTRAVILGFIATILLLLYFSKKINFIKTVLIGIPIFVLSIWLLPAIKSTFFGELYELTKYEIMEKKGNVWIRLDTYDYYFKEIMKSPIIGKGIWHDRYRESNPEYMKHKELYLGDIGATGLFFHLGLLGAIWLIMLLAKIYRLAFFGGGRLKENIHYGLIGYFIFSIATIPTLNCLTSSRNILYLALALALISQLNYSDQKSQKAK